jgi:predicted nucleotidyltransferase
VREILQNCLTSLKTALYQIKFMIKCALHMRIILIEKYKFYNSLKAQSFVEQIWLFGSRARGDNQDRADIDLAIYCPKASIQDWQLILDIIENADTLLKIDCVRLDTVDEFSDLKRAVLSQGKIIYERL